MDIDDILDHYETLLTEHEWLLWVPASWSVVRPTGGVLELEEVARRVARDCAYHFEYLPAREASDLVEDPCLLIQQLPWGYWFLDTNDIAGTQRKLLGDLGTQAQFWSVGWLQASRGYEFIYAERGQERVRRSDFRSPLDATPDVPQSLAASMDIVRSAWIVKPRRYIEAGILSVITLETSAILESDWFYEDQLTLVCSGL